MRRTVTFDSDVAAAIDKLRRERGVGTSAVVNALVRDGLTRRPKAAKFAQRASPMRAHIDVTNVAAALELLDGPTAR